MKKFLFLLMSVAVLSASAGINKAPLQKKIGNVYGSKTKMEQVVRKAAPGTVSTPYTGVLRATRDDVPEGYAQVTLTAGDVWGDGSGYQMLLDADATAFGVEIPETGAMTSSGDVDASVMAAFEYTIPTGVDGTLSTTNIVINNSVTILIPAGTYDWCITNPTPGDRMWIASDQGNVGGRANDYVFKSGATYEFTVYLSGQHDATDVVIYDPKGINVPIVEVTPAATSAYVEWPADPNAEGYDLRWRPAADMSGYHEWHFTLDSWQDDIQGWWVYDMDGDSLAWDLNYSSTAQDDACFFSQSWDSSAGNLTPDNWLGTPDVPLKGELKFTMWGPSDYWPDNVQVYAMVDTMLYQLFEEDLQTSSSHVTYTVDLSEFDGVEGCIVFRHYNCSGQYYVYLDDVCIGEPVEPAEWHYEYNLTDNHYTIEGLTPETTYEVEVMAYAGNDETDWSKTVVFTTLAELKDVYMLGGDDQGWDPTQGVKFNYNAEDNIYTLNYTFPAEYNYFGFTTELAENNDQGGWDYIEPFRFGAIADEGNDYWYTGEEDFISLTWDEYHAIRIPGGEYNMTIDLEAMRLIIEPVTPAGLRGDVNMDNNVSIADVTALIDYLLSHDATGISVANADCNLDENVSIADVTALIDYLLSHEW